MKKILFVNACPRPHSRTLYLARHVLDRLTGVVEEVNVFAKMPLPLDWSRLKERDAAIAKKDFTSSLFDYARQFAAADEIVIAAPYWDLAFPSALRVYFEYVTVTGLTFSYSSDGFPVGLCRASRLFYVTTAGGPIGSLNLGYDYVKALAETYYGISSCFCFTAENLDIVGADVPSILRDAVETISTASF